MRQLIKGLSVALAVCAFSAVLTSSRPASADIIVTYVSTVAEGGNFRWTYNAQLGAGTTLGQFSYFTIYDFFGYVTGSQTHTTPVSWSNTTNAAGQLLLGVNPISPVNPPILDTNKANNLSWQFVAAPITAGLSNVNLGTFTALSSIGTVGTGIYGWQLRNSNVNLQTSGNNFSVATPTPEPLTLALYGVGLVGVITVYRRRRPMKAAEPSTE